MPSETTSTSGSTTSTSGCKLSDIANVMENDPINSAIMKYLGENKKKNCQKILDKSIQIIKLHSNVTSGVNTARNVAGNALLKIGNFVTPNTGATGATDAVGGSSKSRRRKSRRRKSKRRKTKRRKTRRKTKRNRSRN